MNGSRQFVYENCYPLKAFPRIETVNLFEKDLKAVKLEMLIDSRHP